MSDSLEHYGRLGMKWYQHKFGAENGRAMYTKKNEARYSKDNRDIYLPYNDYIL